MIKVLEQQPSAKRFRELGIVSLVKEGLRVAGGESNAVFKCSETCFKMKSHQATEKISDLDRFPSYRGSRGACSPWHPDSLSNNKLSGSAAPYLVPLINRPPVWPCCLALVGWQGLHSQAVPAATCSEVPHTGNLCCPCSYLQPEQQGNRAA